MVESQSVDMPNDVTDPETGQFVSKYGEGAFRGALADLGETGTAEVAEYVGCTHDTAYKRLNKLAKSEDIDRRRVAGAILWSLPEGEDER